MLILNPRKQMMCRKPFLTLSVPIVAYLFWNDVQEIVSPERRYSFDLELSVISSGNNDEQVIDGSEDDGSDKSKVGENGRL